MDWMQLYFAIKILVPLIIFGGFGLVIGALLIKAAFEGKRK